MTVRQLIWKLERMPQEMQVLVRDSSDIITEAEGVECALKLEDYPCAGFDVKGELDMRDGAVVIGRV